MRAEYAMVQFVAQVCLRRQCPWPAFKSPLTLSHPVVFSALSLIPRRSHLLLLVLLSVSSGLIASCLICLPLLSSLPGRLLPWRPARRRPRRLRRTKARFKRATSSMASDLANLESTVAPDMILKYLRTPESLQARQKLLLIFA